MTISLNFVAHQDDDLLFMNPEIAESGETEIQVIIYMTQGDDGNDAAYIKMRQEAAWCAWGIDGLKHTAIQQFWNYKSSCFRLHRPYGELYELWLSEKQFVTDRIRRDIDHYKPDLIRVHDPDVSPAIDHDEPDLDHIDHIYSAKFVMEAVKDINIPVFAYMGYPIRYQPDNLNEHQVELKTKMWRAYQSIDTSVAGEQWDIALKRCYKRQLQ